MPISSQEIEGTEFDWFAIDSAGELATCSSAGWGAADRGIVWRQLGSDPGQLENTSNGAHQVIVRDDLVEIERIEQLSLILAAPAHHHPSPPMFASADGITVRQSIQMTFATKSARLGSVGMSGFPPLLG
jgi:hypothetical protein